MGFGNNVINTGNGLLGNVGNIGNSVAKLPDSLNSLVSGFGSSFIYIL